jgi:hypothetical protein
MAGFSSSFGKRSSPGSKKMSMVSDTIRIDFDFFAAMKSVNLFQKGVAKAMEQAMEGIAMKIMGRALYLTPIDTGRLRNSARITKTGKGLTTGIGFSFNTIYAVYVHENLMTRHDAPTQAKFLERAIREVMQEVPGIMKQAVAGLKK